MPSPQSKMRPPCTRYGPIKGPDSKFLTEERFAWQKARYQSDVVYSLPPAGLGARSVTFSSSIRQGMADENPDAKKRSTGPGSYDTGHCYDHVSEYNVKHAARFGAAARESMAVKTPSPGAVYNIEKVYWNGPDKGKQISFNCDHRKPLYEGGNTDADMLWPSLSKGTSITIAKRIKYKNHAEGTPGCIYNIQEKRSGPSFSFGKGRGNRFSSFGFLPEIFND